jgi:hypothetical protein
MHYLNFLEHRNYRYLKWAGVLVGFALLAYWATKPSGGASFGGTWFGYLLGSVSLALVLLLAWYGVRRRRTPRMPDRRRADRRRMMQTAGDPQPRRRGRDRRLPSTEESRRNRGTLQGWLSAHVYLGTALIAVVSLHSGFRFGWNVHTLA